MLEAFKKGKKVSQLSSFNGDAISALLAVYNSTDGEMQKSTISTLIPYLEEQLSYGVTYDSRISAPIAPRVGSGILHRTLPIHSKMRGCLLNDDGDVVKYLNDNSWDGEVLDGSMGQVMVEIPAYYRKFADYGYTKEVRISEYALPDYAYVPKKYVSAFEATVQRTGNKLASVVNLTADYRGGNNNADWDGTYRSLLGRPATSISRTNFRTYARNRKSGSTKWNCMTYDIQKDLYWLFAIEYATLNSQAAYNAELTSEGYHQGGLGAGVSTLSDGAWNTFNAYNPFIPCGHTNSLGNFSGVVPFTMPSEYGNLTVQVPRYRGIENPFGHIWQWTDGINVQITPNDGDGVSRVYVCDDPSKFNDINYTGYRHVGNEARAEGYVKAIIFGEEGDIMPAEVGGGDSVYFCDYHYTNIPTSTALRGVRFGGTAVSGARCGFAFASSHNAPSSTAANVGSRLCFIPE